MQAYLIKCEHSRNNNRRERIKITVGIYPLLK